MTTPSLDVTIRPSAVMSAATRRSTSSTALVTSRCVATGWPIQVLSVAMATTRSEREQCHLLPQHGCQGWAEPLVRSRSTTLPYVRLSAAFRDWAGETTAHPCEVIDAALALRIRDKAEAAYARGDLFAKRRKLMEDWADFLSRPFST